MSWREKDKKKATRYEKNASRGVLNKERVIEETPVSGLINSVLSSREKYGSEGFEKFVPLLEEVVTILGGKINIKENRSCPKKYSSNYEDTENTTRENYDIVVEEINSILSISKKEDKNSEFMRNLLYGMIHDIRSDLTIILNNMEIISLLVEEALPSLSDHIYEEIQSSLKEMKMGINLCTATTERAVCDFRKSLVEINLFDMTENSIKLCQCILNEECITRKKKVKLMNLIGSSAPYVNVIPSEVNMAIMNIVKNAVVHGVEDKGKISIFFTYRRNESHTYLDIHNDGKPIPKDIANRLFKKPLESEDVHGYGLYTASKSLEKFGGSISFNTCENRTTFSLKLPSAF